MSLVANFKRSPLGFLDFHYYSKVAVTKGEKQFVSLPLYVHLTSFIFLASGPIY